MSSNVTCYHCYFRISITIVKGSRKRRKWKRSRGRKISCNGKLLNLRCMCRILGLEASLLFSAVQCSAVQLDSGGQYSIVRCSYSSGQRGEGRGVPLIWQTATRYWWSGVASTGPDWTSVVMVNLD